MRKLFMFLALGAFMTASVAANACDETKAANTGKSSKSCCSAKGMKASATKECTTKDMKACAKASKDCTKEMKASKDVKSSTAKKDLVKKS